MNEYGVRWNEIGREETEVLWEKCVTVLLCPPHIPHGLQWG